MIHYDKSRCAGCYVIFHLRFSDGCINVQDTFNAVLYVGKGNLDRASAHFPSKKNCGDNGNVPLTKQQKALVTLLSEKQRIGVIALHCCHSAIAFGCEKVLIKHFQTTIHNSYSGHKHSLSVEALLTLETAALEYLFARISDCDFDLEY